MHRVRIHPAPLLSALLLPIAISLLVSSGSPVLCDGEVEKEFAFAEGLYAQGQYEMARDKFSAFIAKYATHANAPLALFRAGECNFRLGRHDEAAPFFDKLVKQHPASEEAEPGWLWLGDSLYKAGKYDEAAAAYQGLVDKFKDSQHAARALYWRGESLYQLGRYEQAAASYEEARKRKLGQQESAYALYSIGMCHLGLRQYPQAIEHLRQTITDYPQTPVLAECSYLIGTAQQAQGDYESALKTFRQFVAEHADSPFAAPARLRVGWCLYDQKQYEAAVKAFEQVRQAHPDTPSALEARLRMADCQFQLGRWDQAAGIYGELTADKQAKWADEALYWLAITHERRGKPQEALNTHQRVPKEHPKSPRVTDAYSHIGQIHSDAGQVDQAIAAYEAALKAAKDPKDKLRATACLTWAQYAKDKSAQRLVELEKIIASEPQSWLAAEISCQVARAHFDEGRHEAALKLLNGFAQRYPKHPRLAEAVFIAAACQEQVGNATQAEALYRRVIEGGGDSKYVGHAASALVGVYAKSGNLAKARETADALGKSGARPEAMGFALYELAQALYQAEGYAEAAELYEKSVAAAPDVDTAPYAQLGLGWARLSAGETQQAVAAFEVVATKYGASVAFQQLPSGLLAAAEKLFEQEKNAQAGALYAKIVDRFPESDVVGEASYKLGWVALRQEKPDEALPLFLSAAQKAESEPVVADARYQAARIFAGNGEHAKAAEALAPFVSEHTEFAQRPWALALLARSQAAAGDSAASHKTCEVLAAAYKDHPAAAQAYLGLGKQLRAQKKYDEAISELQKTAGGLDQALAAEAQFEIAACHRDKGDLNAAGEEFLKVSILYVSEQWAARAQYEAGGVFERLNDKDKALKSYQVIVDRYETQAEWVTKAKERIQALQ